MYNSERLYATIYSDKSDDFTSGNIVKYLIVSFLSRMFLYFFLRKYVYRFIVSYHCFEFASIWKLVSIDYEQIRKKRRYDGEEKTSRERVVMNCLAKA